MVTIKLNLTLINIAGVKDLCFEIESSKLLVDILKEIKIPVEEVGMVIKNGTWSPIECIIEKNDEIQLFPVLSGG